MASTNKTTNYELSQYIGTDKPTYLTDYNQDMYKIDAGIHEAKSEADNNATSIGTLSSLTTTAKTDLVSAINEIDGEVATNTNNISTNTSNIATNTTHIGTLTNLTTSAKTDLVVAANEINAKVGNISNLETNTKTSTVAAINEIVENFNITHFDAVSNNDITTSNVSSYTQTLNVATNEDGSIFKLYGQLVVIMSTSGTATVSFPTRIRPSSNLTISGAGITFWEFTNGGQAQRMASFSIDTNGVVTITLNTYGSSGETLRTLYTASLYFAKDFGDVPTPSPNP